MLPNTFGNRCSLLLINCTLIYLFTWLYFMGLVPVAENRKRNKYELSFGTSLYSFLGGFTCNAAYLWHIIALFMDPKLENLYPGVGIITASLLYLSSFLLMASFYGLGFVNRRHLRDFYNETKDLYNVGFSSFYDGKFGSLWMKLSSVDSTEEVQHTYIRLFNKAVLLNSLVLLSIGVMAWRAQIVVGVSAYHFALFHLLPYVVKSASSSFLYLHGCGTSFMFFKLNLNLLKLREELKIVTSAEGKKTLFEKMSKFCEVSDAIDHLGVCFDNVNGLAITLTDLFSIQILVTMGHSVILTIHELFTQYQAISKSMRGAQTFDPVLLVSSIAYIVLVVVEIFMIVNVTDSCHSGSLRIGKTLQSLLYFDDIDDRLKQSIETFSLQVAHTKLQVTLCGMHLLDFPLMLSVIDATLTYIIIMIQFDLK